jgi:hypothetical protein
MIVAGEEKEAGNIGKQEKGSKYYRHSRCLLPIKA